METVIDKNRLSNITDYKPAEAQPELDQLHILYSFNTLPWATARIHRFSQN